MWQLGVTPMELVVRTTIIYLLFLDLLRLSGKRQLGQFTLFEIALVLLSGNAPHASGSPAGRWGECRTIPPSPSPLTCTALATRPMRWVAPAQRWRQRGP